MPKYVDHEERASQIVDCAMRALSEGGFAQLTLRNLAKRLGGSITLVTHYFPNRDALIGGILEQAERDSATGVAQLAAIDDPASRLSSTLEWFLPLTPDALVLDRARIALVAHRDSDPAVDDFVNRLEPAMRKVLAVGVNAMVEAGSIGAKDKQVTEDLLRSWSSGIALCAVEHPEIWSASRQRRALNTFVNLLLSSAPSQATKTPSGHAGVRRNRKTTPAGNGRPA